MSAVASIMSQVSFAALPTPLALSALANFWAVGISWAMLGERGSLEEASASGQGRGSIYRPANRSGVAANNATGPKLPSVC